MEYFTQKFSGKERLIKACQSGEKKSLHILTFPNKGRKCAFTLAEVLITLGIIGVVAAITMPTLIQNYKNELRVQRLKSFYSTWSQAFQKILTDEGVERLSDTQLWSNIGECPAGCSEDSLSGLKKYIKFEYDHGMIKMTNGATIIYQEIYLYTKDSSTCKKIKELGGSMCGRNGFLVVGVDSDTTNVHYDLGRNLFSFYISDDGKLYPSGGKDFALFEQQTDLSSNSRYWKSPSAYPFYKCDGTITYFGCTARIMENGWKIDY